MGRGKRGTLGSDPTPLPSLHPEAPKKPRRRRQHLKREGAAAPNRSPRAGSAGASRAPGPPPFVSPPCPARRRLPLSLQREIVPPLAPRAPRSPSATPPAAPRPPCRDPPPPLQPGPRASPAAMHRPVARSPRTPAAAVRPPPPVRCSPVPAAVSLTVPRGAGSSRRRRRRAHSRAGRGRRSPAAAPPAAPGRCRSGQPAPSTAPPARPGVASGEKRPCEAGGEAAGRLQAGGAGILLGLAASPQQPARGAGARIQGRGAARRSAHGILPLKPTAAARPGHRLPRPEPDAAEKCIGPQ